MFDGIEPVGISQGIDAYRGGAGFFAGFGQRLYFVPVIQITVDFSGEELDAAIAKVLGHAYFRHAVTVHCRKGMLSDYHNISPVKLFQYLICLYGPKHA